MTCMTWGTKITKTQRRVPFLSFRDQEIFLFVFYCLKGKLCPGMFEHVRITIHTWNLFVSIFSLDPSKNKVKISIKIRGPIWVQVFNPLIRSNHHILRSNNHIIRSQQKPTPSLFSFRSKNATYTQMLHGISIYLHLASLEGKCR